MRWAFVSATYSLPSAKLMPGRLVEQRRPCRPSSPPRNVVTVRVLQVDHLDLAVVRVGDVQLAVVVRDAEGVLELGRPCRSPSSSPKSNRPVADERRRPGPRRPAAPCGSALTSLSATYRFLPSVASPLGWAKRATVVAGRRRCSRAPLPANGPIVLLLQVERPDLVVPGHRDEQRVAVEEQVPRAVQPASPAPGRPRRGRRSCSPVPAIVLTVFAFRSSARIRWFLRSAT